MRRNSLTEKDKAKKQNPGAGSPPGIQINRLGTKTTNTSKQGDKLTPTKMANQTEPTTPKKKVKPTIQTKITNMTRLIEPPTPDPRAIINTWNTGTKRRPTVDIDQEREGNHNIQNTEPQFLMDHSKVVVLDANRTDPGREPEDTTVEELDGEINSTPGDSTMMDIISQEPALRLEYDQAPSGITTNGSGVDTITEALNNINKQITDLDKKTSNIPDMVGIMLTPHLHKIDALEIQSRQNKEAARENREKTSSLEGWVQNIEESIPHLEEEIRDLKGNVAKKSEKQEKCREEDKLAIDLIISQDREEIQRIENRVGQLKQELQQSNADINNRIRNMGEDRMMKDLQEQIQELGNRQRVMDSRATNEHNTGTSSRDILKKIETAEKELRIKVEGLEKEIRVSSQLEYLKKSIEIIGIWPSRATANEEELLEVVLEDLHLSPLGRTIEDVTARDKRTGIDLRITFRTQRLRKEGLSHLLKAAQTYRNTGGQNIKVREVTLESQKEFLKKARELGGRWKSNGTIF